MLVLLGTALTASFFDSLNPSAIAQQMILQAMIKNKRSILFFIFGIWLADVVMGLAVYYGIAAWVSRLFSDLSEAYPLYIHVTEAAAGLVCFMTAIRQLKRIKRISDAPADMETKSPERITGLSLFIMGAAFCMVELTSALPYFGFLALLSSYSLPPLYVMGYILVYNMVYIFPLILLYFGYNKLRGTAFIMRLERILNRVSAYVIPVAVILLGILLVCHGGVSLLHMSS